MRLPAYQASGTLDIGGGPRLQSPDTSLASAFSNVGRVLVEGAEDRHRAGERADAKVTAARERHENLTLEYDLLQSQNNWQQRLNEAQENSTPDAADFTQGFQREMQSDVDMLAAKYSQHHDQDYVRLKIAQAQNPLVDSAAKFEFSKGLEFKKRVLDDKVASLASSFAAGDAITLDQVTDEYKKFVDSSISANPNVRQQGYQYGLRTIQDAYIRSRAGRDKSAFLDAYKAAVSVDANSAVLPPHISTTITNAQAQGADPQLMLAIGWIESELNPAAGRPMRNGREMSSAEGMFQVLAGDNKVAAATRKALGISRADVRDVDKVSTALSAFLVRKQEWMRSNNIEPTPGRTYMMWNLGEGAAAAVMRANPNERIELVLSRVWASQGAEFVQTALSNNPSMYRPGMTVGQVIANYETKVRSATSHVGKITAGAGLSNEDRAKTFVTQFAGIKPEDQFVTSADLAKTAEEVVADHGREQKSRMELERGQARINGALPMDPYSSEHKKDVEKALELNFPPLVEGVAEGDGASLSTIRSIAAEVRHVPEPLRNAMRTTLETGEAGAKARVYGTLLDLRRADRTAFQASNFDSDTEKRIEEFEAFTTELMLPPEMAIARIDALRSEEGKARAKATASEVGKELGKVNDRKLLKSLSYDRIGAPGIDEGSLTPLIRSHYETVYRAAREDGKDRTEAEALAGASIKSAFSASYVSSGGREASVMLYTPETQYPALSNGHDWIAEQARNRIAAHLLSSGRVRGREGQSGGASGRAFSSSVPAWKEAEDLAAGSEFRIVSTGQTGEDVRRGRPASYELWTRNSRGQVELVTDSFLPDVEQAIHTDRARFSAGHVSSNSQAQRDLARWLNDGNLAN